MPLSDSIKDMKILDAPQIRTCDKFTIENEPIASIDLMERASDALAQWLLDKYGQDGTSFTIFAGSGNNGGDALALTRILSKCLPGQITAYQLNIGGRLSPDCSLNLERLKRSEGIRLSVIEKGDALPAIDSGSVVIDGIFGSGLNRPVDGYWATIIEHINHSGNEIVAIDIPSGLFCWNNSQNAGAIIKAKYTLSLQLPKLPFMFAENEQYVGQWHILPIGISAQAIADAESNFSYTTKSTATDMLKPRPRFAHKGTFGNALLVAGSYQMCGASVLSAKACLHTGCGLLTVHVPPIGYAIMQTAVPEAIVNVDETESEYCKPEALQRFSAIGIGPGIGLKPEMRSGFATLLKSATVPMVIDADAINILADTPDLLKLLKPNTILTPHPGEFDRLTHKHSSGYERLQTQIEFARRHNVIIVLKGAFTSIAMPDGEVHFNSTGNPGMATAGSGDVLTGIILSLLSQRYTPAESAILGVYLHGLAGDIGVALNGQQWLTASDIVANIGKAFLKLNK